MGWTFSERWRTRSDMVAYLRSPGFYSPGYERLQSTTVGNHHWSLLKRPDGTIMISLELMQGSKPGYPGWGYKGISEDMGPNEVDCPLHFLDKASPPTCEYARAWREDVRAYHAKKKSRPPLEPGRVVALAGHEYRLTRPIGPRRGWYVERVSDGARFRMNPRYLAQSEVRA